MSPEWGTLPLLPLRCIMDHLSVEDAMSAMSTCRHWRSTILLYEGRRETLRLRAKHFEKSLYVARVFRKYTRRLHVYLDCSEEDLENFMNYVLPIFFDTVKLRELVFIGPSYIQQTHFVPVVKLKRIITESLIYKHLHSLETFALMGCEMGIAKGETEKLTPKPIEYYSRPLSFSHVLTPSDTILRCSTGLMVFSALQHIIVDYEHINTEALESLSQLTTFSHLTINISYKRQLVYTPIDWDRVDACYPNRLEVSVNMISLPHTKFDEIIENVLCEGMCLVSLKVMFCKVLYAPLIEHIVRVHKESLLELVWCDAPYDSSDVYHRASRPNRPGRPDRPDRPAQYGINNVNPFILLCWQCTQLRRLVIHGYWIWQYDLVGCARLRKSLAQLQVSAVHDRPDELGDAAPRVLAGDAPLPVHRAFLQEMNEYTSFKWSPIPWSSLPAGLRARPSPQQRCEYVRQETLRPLGVT